MFVILKCIVPSNNYFYGSKTLRHFNNHQSTFVKSLQYSKISSNTQDHLFKNRKKLLKKLLKFTLTEQHILFAQCNSNIQNFTRTLSIPILCFRNHQFNNNYRRDPNKFSFRSLSLACGLAILFVSCSQSMKGKDCRSK